MANIDYTKSPLVKKFIEVEKSENKVKNIFLYAGGGYGKTTALCCLFKYLLDKASNGEKIAPIYIDVKKLNFNKPNPIISYIHSKYSGSDTQESDVENLFSDQAPEFSKKYTYYILIDGLNETNDGNKGNLIDIISYMTQISNIRFVVSSRIKEIFDKAPFYVFELQKLNEEQIKDYLDKNFGKKYNEQTEVKRINKSLIEILQIPMFMKTFSKTYDKRSPYPDIYDEKTVRKADILDSYVQKILINLKERTNSYDNNILEFVINFYLPALAFQMVKLNGFFIPNENFENINIVLNKDYFSRFFDPDEIEIISDVFDSKSYKPLTIGIKQFAILIKSNGYSFVHQIWRDFFAAKHIINCMNAEKLDELEIFVDENIRQFVGELMRECDFEEKDNLETWSESPIEHFMQENYKKINKNPIIIRNLIEIMKTARNNHITANYSNLNLSETTFELTNISYSEFYSCIFSDTSFKTHTYLFRKNEPFSYFNQKYAVTPSGRYYVCASNHNFVVFDTATQKEYVKSKLVVLTDIYIQQIVFIDDNRLIVRYPYCLAFFHIINRQLEIENVYYFINNGFYSFDDYLDDKVNLYYNGTINPIGYIDSEKNLLNLCLSLNEETRKKILGIYEEFIFNNNQLDMDTLMEYAYIFDDIISHNEFSLNISAFMKGITKEDFTDHTWDMDSVFLSCKGDIQLDNFTLDRANNEVYISCNKQIYKYNYSKANVWLKVTDNSSGGNVLFVPNYGILSIPTCVPNGYGKPINRVIDYIDRNNNHVTTDLYELVDGRFDDDSYQIFENIRINSDKPILKIVFSRGKKFERKCRVKVYYNFVSGDLETIDEKIINDKYLLIDTLYYKNSKQLSYELFDNSYCLIKSHEKLKNNDIVEKVKMLKLDENSISEKLIYKYTSIESVKAKIYQDAYLAIFVPEYNKIFYYDFKKKKFCSKLNKRENQQLLSQVNIRITPFNAKTIFKYSTKPTIDEWLVYERLKNIGEFLEIKNMDEITLSPVYSNDFTWFYSGDLLYVNLIQSGDNGNIIVSLHTFNKANSYIYNNYLIYFSKNRGVIQIFDLNDGRNALSRQYYTFIDKLSSVEKETLENVEFEVFAELTQLKVHITDKCYISINQRIIILDCVSNEFVSIPDIGKRYTKLETTKKYIIKENVLFGIDENEKLFILFFSNDNSLYQEIDTKYYKEIYDCEDSLFFTLDEYNEFSIWDYSMFDVNKMNEFRPLVTISFDYLTSLNVDKAKFDDNCDLNDYQKNQLSLIGADFQ